MTEVTVTDRPLPELIEIGARSELDKPELRARALAALEEGNIVFMPRICFELTRREQEIMLDDAVMQPAVEERRARTGRPTLIYDPASRKLERTQLDDAHRREIAALLDRFGAWARELVVELLPSYASGLEQERVTFRTTERSNPQGMHVDSAYGHPSGGRSMLRVFCNIHPSGRPRTWHVGEPFEFVARRFLPGLPLAAPKRRWRERLGLAKPRRTLYDDVIHHVHDAVKADRAYQESAPRKIVEFPSGSTWLALTDLVMHGGYAGRYSLDQTFFLATESMNDPARSSLRVLERLTGQSLA